MSKTFRSRLTGLRKKGRPGPDQADCLDGLNDCFRAITTLAGLLEVAGGGPQAEFLKPGVASHAGTLILAEVKKAGQWLNQLKTEAR